MSSKKRAKFGRLIGLSFIEALVWRDGGYGIFLDDKDDYMQYKFDRGGWYSMHFRFYGWQRIDQLPTKCIDSNNWEVVSE